MSTREAFVDAINADPTDFETRRVYADWLEERGDPAAAGWRVLNATGRVPDYRMHDDEKYWTFWSRPSSYRRGWHWVPTVIETAGFIPPMPNAVFIHPKAKGWHPTAVDALQVAAECIVEITARGVDIEADKWPGQEVEA